MTVLDRLDHCLRDFGTAVREALPATDAAGQAALAEFDVCSARLRALASARMSTSEASDRPLSP